MIGPNDELYKAQFEQDELVYRAGPASLNSGHVSRSWSDEREISRHFITACYTLGTCHISPAGDVLHPVMTVLS